MSGKQFSLDSRLDLFHGIETSHEARSTSAPTTAHPPLLEDFNEYDEGNRFLILYWIEIVEDEYGLCLWWIVANGDEKSDSDQLVVPQRHIRSKSLTDHQVPLIIENQPCIKCTKCGHELDRH